MSDNFKDNLWKLGEDTPELRTAIAGFFTDTDTDNEGYAIPAIKIDKDTGACETIEERVERIDDPDVKARYKLCIKKCGELKVKDLADFARYVREALARDEKAGIKLLKEEKTIRDMDVLSLAVSIYGLAVIYSHNGRLPRNLTEEDTQK